MKFQYLPLKNNFQKIFPNTEKKQPYWFKKPNHKSNLWQRSRIEILS